MAKKSLIAKQKRTPKYATRISTNIKITYLGSPYI